MQKKKPFLQDQHLLFLFPITIEQFVHIPFEQQYKEELFHPLIKFYEKLEMKNNFKKDKDINQK